MSRYSPVSPVRLPNDYGIIKAVVVWSKPKKSDPLQFGPVRSEAILSPRGEVVSKTWGEDLAEYVNLLAVRTLRHGGVDPEILSNLMDRYSDEIRIAYHIGTDERTYSEALILKFWRTDVGLLRYSAQASHSFPEDILPFAQRLGEITVALSQKGPSPAPDLAVNPEVSSLHVSPYHFPIVWN
ncbi:TPA: hypothetical protein JAJ60_002552 [Corynebacterium striatum]|nr:hypothetical protein [Corynebacterium striatum]HAT1199961.1 hypothetical protein [Corynebacterium striatum]HAT1212428.1 hypothetical protein [Corynebacterium striatum]HAT1282650.1 hypothetical protein [Corynebacterium striatum]HAT1341851.1 hypothetical protein [Corynebacterium striatum]